MLGRPASLRSTRYAPLGRLMPAQKDRFEARVTAAPFEALVLPQC